MGGVSLRHFPGTSGSLFSQAPTTPELPAGAAILTSRPWTPVARYLQSTPCRNVCADSTAVEGPNRPCPAAPSAACPDTFQAAAGAARDHGEEGGGKGMGDAAGGTEGPAAGWGPAESGALHLAAHSVKRSSCAGLGVWRATVCPRVSGQTTSVLPCHFFAMHASLAPPHPSALSLFTHQLIGRCLRAVSTVVVSNIWGWGRGPQQALVIPRNVGQFNP